MNWIGLKHVILTGIEAVCRFFYWHKHNYVVYVQPEIKFGSFTQPATLDDPRGCYCKCTRCGKYIPFEVIKCGDGHTVDLG